MIEKKTVWAVTNDLSIIEKVAIVEDKKVLATKGTDEKDDVFGFGWDILRYFGTEEKAKEFVEGEEKSILGMVPKVRDFIDRLNYQSNLRKKLGIEKKDYLGSYADDNRSNYRQQYIDECDYAKKLEEFIKSHMLNIDGCMIPIDQVQEVQWYATDYADDYEPSQWKAVLTTANDEQFSTKSEEDVRLVWATIGRCIGRRFIDNDIDYDESDDDDK